MLEVEAALARSVAGAGVIPHEHADAIERACRDGRFDIRALGAAAVESGSPVIPLVRALTAAVGGEAAGSVHLGATSQDILDSAVMLVTRQALLHIEADLAAAADAAAGLAADARDTPMVGRTLLQGAAPITFGLKAAGWLSALDDAATTLATTRRTALALQLGGAVGTLASLGDAGPRVVADLAITLDLVEPTLPWHTDRRRIATIATSLGTSAGTIAKIALDIVLLSQSEVAEVHDRTPGLGGSSTLPGKRNPVAAVAARSAAHGTPGLVATLLAAMPGEHERAAGAWQAEWPALRELLERTGSAATWLRDALEHLETDPQRMSAALDAADGRLLGERVATALTPHLGRLVATDLVGTLSAAAVADGRPFLDVLADDHRVAAILERTDLATLLDPAGSLGSAGVFVDRAIEAHRRRVREVDR